MKVDHLHPNGRVEILESRPLGTRAMLKVRDDYGVTHSFVIGESDLGLAEEVVAAIGTLDGDPVEFALGVDALRILNAHLLNPLLALTTANVEPLPHQIQAVYDHLLNEGASRFLLADDPGAGKTVMAGLFVREALVRGWVRSVAVIAPGSLVDQWREELLSKFGLDFELLDLSRSGSSPFTHHPFAIVRLDQLARNVELRQQFAEAAYDLAIMDEAHKLSARSWGTRVMKSKRYELGEIVRDSVDRLLLMTATPHNGKDEDFELFLHLLGASSAPDSENLLHAGLMRRLVKEQLVHGDGSPLFPQRHANTVTYQLSPLELDLYEDVTEYVRHEMNKAAGEERRTVGFALLVLQRRLASSPEAILRSLVRRRDRLSVEVQRVRAADDHLLRALDASIAGAPMADESTADETTAWEDNASAVATTARTAAELETEVAILERLVRRATAVRDAHVDGKWEALSELLESPAMFDEVTGARRKIIIFTEHKDTLEYLEDNLRQLLGRMYEVETIHGGTTRDERLAAQRRFTESERSAVLVATDSAGEGVNLQVAHLMVNYDIPWNPNRLEQRFGRIHRIGQRHECHLWNLVAADTREGDVFATLLDKLERQRGTLGDCVFDVLGEVLHESKLHELLTSAVNGAHHEQIAAGLGALDQDLQDAVERRNAVRSSLSDEDIVELRRRLALGKALSLNPTVVREFVIEALARLHGEITQAGAGWAVRHVPEVLRSASPGLKTRYPEVAFEPVTDSSRIWGPRELLAPGHPLVCALASSVARDSESSLQRGIVLEDDRRDSSYVVVWSRFRDSSGEHLIAAFREADSDSTFLEMNPAGLSSLPMSPAVASAGEAAAVERAATLRKAEGHELLAVAYVRGTAAPETAAEWAAARADVQSDADTPTWVGRPHDPWDVAMETDNQLRFVRATPNGITVPPRPYERAAAETLGVGYVNRVTGS